jgi:hypothetical protein
VAERLETADAAGVVGDGAVADSTVVVGGTSVEDGSGVERPNTFDKRLANIPIMDITPVAASRATASPLQRSTMSRTSSHGYATHGDMPHGLPEV